MGPGNDASGSATGARLIGPKRMGGAQLRLTGRPMKFELTARKVTLALGGVFALLLIAHIFVLVMRFRFGYTHLKGLAPMFHFDTERSVPALFSSFLLAMSAVGLWLSGCLNRSRGEGRCYWCFLALIFVFLAIDETVGIHERLSKPSYEAFGDDYLLSFGWLIPYQVAVAVIDPGDQRLTGL